MRRSECFPSLVVITSGLTGLCVFRVNTSLHAWLVESAEASVPPVPADVVSPFEANLAKVGWVADEESDDDDDDEFEF